MEAIVFDLYVINVGGMARTVIRRCDPAQQWRHVFVADDMSIFFAFPAHCRPFMQLPGCQMVGIAQRLAWRNALFQPAERPVRGCQTAFVASRNGSLG